jgi:hypothetical protein
VSGWRVVLAGGETLAIETDTDSTRYDRRTWYTATYGRQGTGSYVGHIDAMLDLARYHKWDVREIVPPGESTTAEALAAERKRVADVLAETVREFEKRAAACEELQLGYAATSLDPNRTLNDQIDASISAARTSGKEQAYEHAASLIRTANGMLLALHNAATAEPAAGQAPIVSVANVE